MRYATNSCAREVGVGAANTIGRVAMASSLIEILTSQGWSLERESDTASFYNHAPWVAPQAYLHIVFKPASDAALSENGRLLPLPEIWQAQLALANGAMLYSGAMSIYGVVDSHALLNRTDLFNQQPFRIALENGSWPPPDQKNEVVIGGYDYDGTRAILNVRSGQVSAVPRKSTEVLKRWANPDAWITSEMARLRSLHDDTGKLIVGSKETLPG